MPKSDYFASTISKLTFGIPNDLDATPERFIRLYTTLPNSDGTGGVELSDDGYNPVQLSGSNCALIGIGEVANDEEIIFGNAEENSVADIVGCAIWDDETAGNLIGIFPALGIKMNATGAASTNICTTTGSPFINNDKVKITQITGLNLPTGISAGVYFTGDVSGSNFRLSATAGGAEIDITGDGVFSIQRDYSRGYFAGDTLRIKAGELFLGEE